MVAERYRFLGEAEEALRRAGFSAMRVEPASSGKKGLVFLGDSAVVRIYTNPLYYAKTSAVLSRLSNWGFDLAPRILHRDFFISNRPLWVIIEERLSLPGRLSLKQKVDFIGRLGRLHAKTRVSLFAKLLWRRWVGKTVANLEYISTARIEFADTLRGMWRLIAEGGYGPRFVSLCHRDVGLSNMGLRDGRLLLVDWDRAYFFFSLYELVQACYFLDLDPLEALDHYGSNWVDERELLLMAVVFCISRAKKEHRRGTLSERLGRFVKWTERIFTESFRR